jgi:hypothetical protein
MRTSAAGRSSIGAAKARDFAAARNSRPKAVRKPDMLSAGWVLVLTIASTTLAVYDLYLLADLMFR